MEYERKFRWANYGSDKCKEYLRNDFSYECAYCKLQEKEIDIIGSEHFEIDHFKPQSDEEVASDIHLYENLNYSCGRCNGEKSNFWSEDLLNPCKSNIFKDAIHVKGGYDSHTLYKYDWASRQGKIYIDTFKLNSRYHIRIRKRRKERDNYIKIENELIDEILNKFSMKQGLNNLDELINTLDKLRSDKNNRVSDLLREENFEIVEQYLTSKGIKNFIIFEEYNMDFKIKYNEKSIYCELIVDNSNQDTDTKDKFIDKEKLSTWYEELSYNFGVLYFYPKLNKLYLFDILENITKEEVDKINKKKLITLSDKHLI